MTRHTAAVSWEVTQIQATAQHPTSNTLDQPTLGEVTVWDSVNPETYVDGKRGSYRPCTFNIPWGVEPVRVYRAPIELYGTCNFPPGAQGQMYNIRGLLIFEDSVDPVEVFHSLDFPVPVPTGSGPSKVHAKGFMFAFADPVFQHPWPFSCRGDFMWTINVTNWPVTLHAARSTRLELSWARANAPNGPLNVLSSFERTRTNLSGVYPIGLLRNFLPNPLEQNDVPDVPSIQSYGPWYVDRCMRRIWSWPQVDNAGPRYDNQHGAPKYGMMELGGYFALAEWLARVHGTCNCYDLAGISQLACVLLIDENGVEVLNSKWVYQKPNGFIKTGPLYGRLDVNCNSPFWENPKRRTQPITEWNDPRRWEFGNHAWVEVSYGDNERFVLDATHAASEHPLPANGTLSRVGYLDDSLDMRRTPFGNELNKTMPGEPGNDCYQNPEYCLPRIGVLSAHRQALLPVDSDSISSAVQTDIEKTLKRGKTPHQPPPVFNAAPINQEALIELLLAEDGVGCDFSHHSSMVSVVYGVTRTIVKLIERTAAAQADTIVLELDVFDSLERPVEALISHLRGFEITPLKAVIDTCDHPLGAYSFRTSRSVFWVRGNLFIRLSHYSTEDRIDAAALLDLSTQLEAHLVSHHINPGAPTGGLGMSVMPPGMIHQGQQFSVQLRCDGKVLKENTATSDDNMVVLPAGPGNGSGVFRFYARGIGQTNITINVADAVTLRPSGVTFQTTVRK